MTPTDDRGVHTHDYRITGRCICGETYVAPAPVYTPDTHTVRSIFADYWADEAIPSNHPLRQSNREEFDRWLRVVKAEAWDEGREYEAEQAIEGWNGDNSANPYRETT